MTRLRSLFFCLPVFSLLSVGSTATFASDAMLCVKGDLILEESFDAAELDARWSVAKGKWEINEGALKGTELPADEHAASMRTDVELPTNFVMEFDFKFDGGKIIHCSFNGKGHICRATITPKGYILKGEKVKKNPQDKSVTVGQVQQDFAAGQWHTMRVEVAGEEFVAQVGDGPVAFGSHAKVAREKSNFGFPMAGVSSSLDNIKVWSATPNPNWASTKAGLPPNKIVAPAKRTPRDVFARLDKDGNSKLSVEEFIGTRPKEKHELARKQFGRRDKDGDASLSTEEFLPKQK